MYIFLCQQFTTLAWENHNPLTFIFRQNINPKILFVKKFFSQQKSLLHKYLMYCFYPFLSFPLISMLVNCILKVCFSIYKIWSTNLSYEHSFLNFLKSTCQSRNVHIKWTFKYFEFAHVD